MKHILLFATLLLTGAAAQAQAPAIQWEQSYGGSSYDLGQSIQQTTDGGYIVAGYAQSTDGDVTGNHGGYDYWIVKSDATGNLQWEQSLGGSDEDEAYSIQQTTDGGYIVAGYTSSNDGDVTGNHGATDYWVVKLDDTGALQWQKTLGGAEDDMARSIQQTTDGGYIVAGYTWSADGDVTSNHSGASDYWIVKLDATGNLQWQQSLGGSNGDEAYSIQQTTDGGYIVAGETQSTDGDVTGSHGSYDYWVVKLDDTGALQWQKALGGSGDDLAYSIQQTADNGYIVAGNTWSADGDVTGNHGATDYWVVKLDNTGALQWQKALGGTDGDLATSIQQATDGGYIVAGRSASTDGDVTGNHFSYDYWVVKLDDTGALQWQKSLGGSYIEEAYSIQQTTDGGYIVAGDASSMDGDVTNNHDYYDDYWVVKLAPDAPLRLHLISFTGQAQGNTNILQWITTDEANTSGFDIERSADGKRFAKIDSVVAANNAGQHTYSYTDYKPFSSNNYYRLKMQDKDGKFSYSNMVKLSSSASVNNAVTLYPNPAKSKLNISITGAATDNTEISISDLTGKTIKTITTSGNHLTIDISSFTAGTYTLQYKNGEHSETRKFVVEK